MSEIGRSGAGAGVSADSALTERYCAPARRSCTLGRITARLSALRLSRSFLPGVHGITRGLGEWRVIRPLGVAAGLILRSLGRKFMTSERTVTQSCRFAGYHVWDSHRSVLSAAGRRCAASRAAAMSRVPYDQQQVLAGWGRWRTGKTTRLLGVFLACPVSGRSLARFQSARAGGRRIDSAAECWMNT